MKSSIVLIGLFFLASLAFAGLEIAKSGWDAATYFGADVWAPLFVGMGGALVPVILAALAAGMVKVFRWKSDIVKTAATTFLVSSGLFLAAGLISL